MSYKNERAVYLAQCVNVDLKVSGRFHTDHSALGGWETTHSSRNHVGHYLNWHQNSSMFEVSDDFDHLVYRCRLLDVQTEVAWHVRTSHSRVCTVGCFFQIVAFDSSWSSSSIDQFHDVFVEYDRFIDGISNNEQTSADLKRKCFRKIKRTVLPDTAHNTEVGLLSHDLIHSIIQDVL